MKTVNLTRSFHRTKKFPCTDHLQTLFSYNNFKQIFETRNHIKNNCPYFFTMFSSESYDFMEVP